MHLRLAIAAAVLIGNLAPAAAQGDAASGWPKQPIKILLGFAAGGSNDIIARIYAQKLSERLGQPALVENRTGAGGNIAAEALARAAPDGYTIMSAPTGVMIQNMVMYAKAPYDSQKDFAPLTIAANYPFYLSVRADLPVQSVAELIAYGKANPSKANYGSTGGSFRLLSELFNQRTGSSFEHIPYRSSSELVTAIITGQTMMSFIDPAALMPHVRAGKVRVLAQTGAGRSLDVPEAPTMAEAGVTGIESTAISAFVAPAATPPPILAKLSAELIAITRLPDVSERLRQLAANPVGSTPQEFAALVASEIPRWREVMEKAGIKPE